MEPTSSFWDCGEFIAAAYKLQVPHPPGAPLFLLIGRLFSFLSFGDTSLVSYWINFASVVAGAFTSTFLFWSITLIGKQLLKIKSSDNVTNDRIFMLMGAGLVGSLAYTFSDSAWFSAVEAEVYSMSSFFTGFVFWAMLKWQAMEDESRANRWLIFIFYIIGLSIGVHLLNLVTLPALAIIFYFKKYTPSLSGIVLTLMIGLFVVFFINEIIIPGLPTWAGTWEVFFVNSIGLPFGVGAGLFGLLIVSGLIFGVWYSHKKSSHMFNTFFISAAFVLIGYSSYAMVIIRSGYNPPINENDPSDVMSFVRYLKREQYGSRPLWYGPYFTAEVKSWKEGEPVYAKGESKYEIVDHKFVVEYDSKDQTILPRLHSNDTDHQRLYREILNLREGERPTFVDNVRFLFTHQVGWMYVRYFLFNFAGRESDIQNADWLSPRQWFMDVPESLEKNRGRNNFWMIPFLLGLVGMYFQFVHDSKNFFALALLFILTGIALVFYLNSPPAEPRERDYIYTGSYYAFCFWIGLSVITFATWVNRVIKNSRTAVMVATVVCLSAPVLMANEGWDDHNRSKRHFSVDTAVNDLQSCAPDSILFTGGDNDTFMQWYVQDVEDVRTDVRVIVTSYFNTAWYNNQTRRSVNRSQPFPYTLTAQHYREGGPNNPYLPFYDANIKSMDLHQYLDLLKREHKGLKLYPTANVVPTRDIVLKVDVDKVKATGIVPKKLVHLIVPEMHFKLIGNLLELKDLALLDILATADWTRPVYVTYTALRQFKVDLTPYVVREGNTLRILPVLNPNPNDELVNTEVAFNNVTSKFQFRGLDDPRIYYSEDYRGAVQNHRNTINTIARALIEEGDSAKALDLLEFSLMKMPDDVFQYDIAGLETFRLLLHLHQDELAFDIGDQFLNRADQLIKYYSATGNDGRDLRLQLAIIGEVARVYAVYQFNAKAERAEDLYLKYTDRTRFKRSNF